MVYMANVEREPIVEVWGRATSGVRGKASGQGIRGRWQSPPPMKLVAFKHLALKTRLKLKR